MNKKSPEQKAFERTMAVMKGLNLYNYFAPNRANYNPGRPKRIQYIRECVKIQEVNTETGEIISKPVTDINGNKIYTKKIKVIKHY